MKKHLSIVLTLALVAILLPAAFAQSSSSPSAAPQTDQSSPSAAQSPSSQSPSAQEPSTTSPSTSSASGSAESSEESSFTGTVVKSGNKYVLKSDSGATYLIDDQDKAKQFVGKQVKVNGSLDKTTSMLHVTDILPADNR